MGKKISKELKESIIKKALSRGGKTLTEVAKANGVSISAMSKWIIQAQQTKNVNMPDRANRFLHLQSTVSLSETEIGAYCRQHGIYSMQLKEWEKDFMKADSPDNKYKAEVNLLRKKNAKLEKELRRKEKALAEAAALLILKKKADEIWGDGEDD